MNLFHLSFNDKLKTMKPRLPDGSHFNKPGLYPEPGIKRISFSPTPEQCFLAIYPNISKFFEIDQLPWIEMYLYKLASTGVKLITPDVLTEQRYVHDAHCTHEYWVLDPIIVQKVNKLKISIAKDSKDFDYHPFNDTLLPKRYLGPSKLIIDIIN